MGALNVFKCKASVELNVPVIGPPLEWISIDLPVKDWDMTWD